MAIELFWGSGSQFSWRVQLALEHKGLPYESHLLSFSANDHKTPAFLAINPRGRVPTLRDGDVVVYESIAILAYLDRQYPEPPLFGRTPAESAQIWRTVCECLSYLDEPVERVILPLYRGQAAAHETEIRNAIALIDEEVRSHAGRLSGHDFLVGDTPSAADFAVYPLLKALLRAGSKPGAEAFTWPFLPLPAELPAVADWMARIESLPGYERTYPPHWR